MPETVDLTNAVVYDEEVTPQCFTLSMELLNGPDRCTWEISNFRDDRQPLITWLNHLARYQIPMIGFNNIGYDYIILHLLWKNPRATAAELYAKSKEIFASQDKDQRFGHIIWDRDRLTPQIDLFKINHFDNKAKTTSLKALQINMRAPTVVDAPVPFDVILTQDQIDCDLIPYNLHDVKETKRFAHICKSMIEFRIGLVPKFGIEVLNYNDGKIGAKMLEQRLGEDICYDRSSGRKKPRQTPRRSIPLRDIIFPYIQFRNPEFNRVLSWMQEQTLTPEDIDDPEAEVKTKGAFKDVVAHVGGIDFHFGTGGIHGSVKPQFIQAHGDDEIHDIDVEGLYPNIAIKNRLAPEHLGSVFIEEYAKIPIERKLHKKGTYENASLKLGANVPWGQSNNKYSIFYDPKYAMTVPINGQLMLCMLSEWLLTVPTFRIIQINTDGITYYINRHYQPQAKAICEQWEAFTHLTLEYNRYQKMWIRDVNNYIAEEVRKVGSNEPPKLKQKGAYWHPNPDDYANSITTASPPCWYKDLGAIVSTRAAVLAMTQGIDPTAWIRFHRDPYDFMCRARATGAAKLTLDGVSMQKMLRYYVAREGGSLIKTDKPAGPLGAFCRAPKVAQADYDRAMLQSGGQWHPDVCTKNRSTYKERVTAIEAGWKVAECNDVQSFRFDNVNYDWYIAEAKKLIIA